MKDWRPELKFDNCRMQPQVAQPKACHWVTEGNLDDKMINAIQLFIDVTDLFGQIYVVKDMTAYH